MSKKEQAVSKNRAEQLKGIFKIISFIHRYRIFLPFKYITPSFLYGFGHFFARIFVMKPKLRKYIINGLDFLFGNKLSHSKKEKIFQANAKYMASLVFDAMLYSPNIYGHTLDKFIDFQNISYLDDALKEKKGVLLIGTHAGMYFHLIAGLAYHPNRYNVLVINRARNQIMYENILIRPELTNLHALAHADFNYLKKQMISHLSQNGIVIILQDYSKKHNLQVPLIEGSKSQLITTPQSAIRIHRITGAPIVPALIFPQGTIGKSLISFQNPQKINQISQKFWNSPNKIFHGELSIAINSIIYPYLLQHVHIWEELRKLAIRVQHRLEIKENILIKDFYAIIHSKMIAIIENSYEKNRNDELLYQIFSKFNSSEKMLEKAHDFEKLPSISIDLSGLNSNEKLLALIKASIKILANYLNENENNRWKELATSIQRCYEVNNS